MSAPVISPITSLNVYTRGQAFALLLAATGLPAGIIAVTGTQSTNVINATAHGLPNGTRVKFTALTGGAGLTAGPTYYVRDTAADTFKLAATSGGAAIDFTTDISAGVIAAAIWTCTCYDASTMAVALADIGLTFDTASGVLRGTFTASGFYNLLFTATNADGTSAALALPIGIEDVDSTPDSSASITVDVETGAVTRTGGAGAAGEPVLYGKHGSQKLVTVRFAKGGQPVNPDVTELYLGFREFVPDAIVRLSDGTFYATAGGFLVVMDLDAPSVSAALSNYEKDASDQFAAFAEVYWRSNEQVSDGGPTPINSRSRNFLFQIESNLVENAA